MSLDGHSKLLAKLKIEVGKFTIVGVINFALTFVVFTTMLKFFPDSYLFSLALSWLFGITCTFIFNFSWVFNPGNKVQLKNSCIKYFSASVLSIILNMLMLKYLVQHTNILPLFAQMLLIPFVVIFNFITAKFWSFTPSDDA